MVANEAPPTKPVVNIWRKEWKVPPFVYPVSEPSEIHEVKEEE